MVNFILNKVISLYPIWINLLQSTYPNIDSMIQSISRRLFFWKGLLLLLCDPLNVGKGIKKCPFWQCFYFWESKMDVNRQELFFGQKLADQKKVWVQISQSLIWFINYQLKCFAWTQTRCSILQKALEKSFASLNEPLFACFYLFLCWGTLWPLLIFRVTTIPPYIDFHISWNSLTLFCNLKQNSRPFEIRDAW